MTTFYDFALETIEGRNRSLADFKGKVVLAVNVASRCGFTPQYRGLQALYDRFSDKGLVVAGFPSNDFGAQEPGTEAEIAQFCEVNYGVTFPLFSKVPVKGASKHPLYAFLTSAAQPAGEVKWNFEKFLIGKDGAVLARFPSNVEPNGPEITAAVQKALG